MLSFECIKNEKSVYFLLTSAFTANIGHGEARTFHMPKWISFERSVAFTQNIPQVGEVHRPASGCIKPCRNGVINKKEAVRMLFLEYNILQQPLFSLCGNPTSQSAKSRFLRIYIWMHPMRNLSSYHVLPSRPILCDVRNKYILRS